jgi:hypothetical protein
MLLNVNIPEYLQKTNFKNFLYLLISVVLFGIVFGFAFSWARW